MLILTFEEFNNKFIIDNIATSDIGIKDIGKDISLTPIEIVMRDQGTCLADGETWSKTYETPENTTEPNFNIIINLHPTDSTHWVLVIRREGGPVYYFDSFGVETPPLFLEEYVHLGSNERIQQYDESYCGAYCLYMIYLIDRGIRIKSALNILVNQCKYPGIYNECFCLGCNFNQGRDEVLGTPTCFADDNVNVNDNDNDNDNDNVIDNVIYNDNANDNVNDNVNDNDNVNVKDNDDVNDNDNVNDNDLRISFANNVNDNDNDNVNDNDNDRDNFIYLFGEKHQKGKPNNNSPTNTISITINDDLQSWLNDDDIITEATFPDNFRCIISGPSKCGKTFLLKKLILASIYFDKLYIIGPTGDQYNGLERINPNAIIE